MARVDIIPVAGAETQIGLLLSVLEDVTQEWTRYLGDVSEEAILWQPFPGGHSIGALMLHIADVEAYWIYQIGAGNIRSEEEEKRLLSEETNQGNVQWPVPPAEPFSWYQEQCAAIRARTRETVLAINDPEHVGKRRNEEFTLRWLLNHVISHEAYHGGQAVLLSLIYSRKPGENS